MIEWLRRLIGRKAPPSPATAWEVRPEPPQARNAEEIAVVEEALEGLIAAGLRLGPRYEGQSLNEAARHMAEHPSFATGDADETLMLTERDREALALDILWSYRALDDDGEDEFANAANILDHCYDGADAETYRDLFRRLITLSGVWTCHAVTVTPVPGLGPYGHGFRVAFETDPPIPPQTFPADKNFDWSLIEHLDAHRPDGEMRRFRVVGDGGMGLVLFITDAQARQVERCIGFGVGSLG